MKESLKALLPATIVAAAAALPAQAPADGLFLQVPEVEGDVVEKGHVKWIELFSWGWGLSNTVTLDSHSQATTEFQALSLVKGLDSASVKLYERVANRGVLGSVKLEATITTGCGLETPLSIDMKEATFTSATMGFSADAAGQPAETFTLIFRSVEVTVRTFDALCKDVTEQRFKWDIVSGEPL